VVDKLVFGVEALLVLNADLLAAYLNSPQATERFKTFHAPKHNYGAAWEKVAAEWHPVPAPVSGPNNILAMSYRRAIQLSKAMMEPLPILRQGNDYNDQTA
jgi:predicted nucleotidyltransferase